MKFKTRTPKLVSLKDMEYGTVFKIPTDDEEIFILIDKNSLPYGDNTPDYVRLAVDLITGSISSFNSVTLVELVNYNFEEI